jgi:hypothetical protein
MDNVTASELAEDLHSLAYLIYLHGDDLPDRINFSIQSLLWDWSGNGTVPEVLATSMRAGLRVGAEVSKVYDDERFRLNIVMPNGTITYQVSAERDKVCTKRVTGTEMVEKEVPPEGEWVKKMVEQEIVEWDCHPLLAVTKGD